MLKVVFTLETWINPNFDEKAYHAVGKEHEDVRVRGVFDNFEDAYKAACKVSDFFENFTKVIEYEEGESFFAYNDSQYRGYQMVRVQAWDLNDFD